MHERLVERSDELAAIGRVFSLGAGGAVIVAPAGGGKTMLVEAAIETAHRCSWSVAHARGTELEHDHAFGVVRQLFERRIARACPAERARWFSGAAGIAAPIVDASAAVAEPMEGFATVHALYWLAVNISDDAPLAIIVDDAHVADEPSLRFLAYLGRRLGGERIVMVVAARAGELAMLPPPITELLAADEMELLRPRPLSVDGVRDVVEQTVGTPWARVAPAIHTATGGNPLLVNMVIPALAASDPHSLDRVDLAAVLRPDVREHVAERVARAGPVANRFAVALATLGGEQPIGLVADLAGLTMDDAAAAAASLRAADVIVGSGLLTFRHPLVAAALELHVAPGMHRRAAQILATAGADDAAVVAQLAREVPAGDAHTVSRLVDAATAAAARGANDVSVALLERALAEPPPHAERPALLAALGRAESWVGRAGAVSHLREALLLTADVADRAVIAADLARAHALRLEHPDAVQVIEAALGELGGAPKNRELFAALQRQLVVYGLEDMAVAMRVIGYVDALAARVDDHKAREIVGLSQAMSLGMLGGSAEECVDCFLRLPPEEDTDDVDWEVRSLTAYFLASVDTTHDWAERLLARVDGVARRTGNARATLLACTGRAMLAEERGDIREALIQGDLTRRIASGFGVSNLTLTSSVLLAAAYLELDDVTAAAGMLAGVDPATSTNLRVATYYGARAQLELAQNNPDAALATMQAGSASIERLLPVTVSSPRLWSWRAPLVTALVRLDRSCEAAAVAEEDLAAARDWGVARGLGIALRNAAMTASGPERIRLLEEAVDQLAPRSARLEYGYALHDLGAAIRRAGRRAAARPLLQEALDVALVCGSVRLARLARDEIAAAGGRPRRERVTGVSALTPTEHRVARLAAQGLTNREIAQHLYVTTKTVEGHLAAAYRKLSITRRGELVGILDVGSD